MENSFVLKGNICHTPTADALEVREGAFAVCVDGVCQGVFDALPETCAGLEVIDCGDSLVFPGLVDLHIHAPQFAFRGTGMDYELLEWLNRYTFPEEVRYADADYATRAYDIFAGALRRSATTRAVIFGTIHTDSTLILADRMEKTGLVSYVGKVNMDRRSPADLQEAGAAQAAAETERFIDECGRRGYRRTRPVITPRFIPTCSDELLAALGKLRRKYDLPVQSHLSENPEEIRLVMSLCPQAAFYGDAYDRFGLFGRDGNAVMAHCIHSTPEEVRRIRDNGVWVAHCPASNMNLASGIAPIRRYLDAGLRVGLGTDTAAGQSESMFRAVTDAIQVSKLYWRHVDQGARPLTFPEAFHMATRGGGAYFGSVGSFEDGREFDAVVLDDAVQPCARRLPVRDRLERAFYLELDRTGIVMKFAKGKRIL